MKQIEGNGKEKEKWERKYGKGEDIKENGTNKEGKGNKKRKRKRRGKRKSSH